MNIKVVFLLLLFASFLSCRKEDPYQSHPFVFPKMDSLPYENDHLKLELITPDAPEGISDMAFVSQDVGFAIDYHGKIFSTTDGGLNWSASYSPQHATYDGDIEFLNENLGVAVSVDGGFDHRTHIMRTTDGGNSWIDVGFAGYSFTSISLVDSIHFIASGSNFVTVSSDGGETWSITDSASGIYKVTHNNTYAFAVNNDGKILRSSDFGFTWDEIGEVSELHSGSTLSFFQGIGYASSYDSIFQTTDNGITWKGTAMPDSVTSVFSVNINPLSSFDCLVFASWGFLNYDYFVEFCAVLQTVDGGLTYEKRIVFSDIGLIEASSFYDNKNGYAVDYAGNLIRVTIK